MAIMAVAAAMALRLALEARFGPGLPTYVTFYPAIMVVALLAGFGPGLLATALTVLVTAYWILPPEGFAVASPVDRVGLVLFAGMGVFMSFVAEVHRLYRHKAVAYDREAVLRESRARLATFAEATFEGIVESEHGRIVDCNEQMARLLGYSVAEMRGMEIDRMIAPEDLDRVKANIRQGHDSIIEHGAVRKDGTRIDVEAHGRPVSPGNSRRHTAIRDITERKMAEQARRESEERYRQLFLSLQEGFYLAEAIFDDQGKCCDARYVDVNPAFERLMGLSRDQIIGKRARELVPGLKSEWLDVFGEVTRTGQAMNHQAHSDVFGKYFESFIFQPAPGQFGVLVSDITERKRSEATLNDSRFAALNLMQDAVESRKQAEQARAGLERSVAELRAANADLARFNRVAVDRELRMVQLKKQVNELCERLGQPSKYRVEFEEEQGA